jgi:hypothetical protein
LRAKGLPHEAPEVANYGVMTIGGK